MLIGQLHVTKMLKYYPIGQLSGFLLPLTLAKYYPCFLCRSVLNQFSLFCFYFLKHFNFITVFRYLLDNEPLTGVQNASQKRFMIAADHMRYEREGECKTLWIYF